MRYKNVIFLCLFWGILFSQEDLLSQLFSKDSNVYQKALEQFKQKEPKILQQYAPVLVQSALGTDKFVRARAKSVLSSCSIRIQAEVPKMIQALKEPNPELQWEALGFLIDLGSEAELAVPELIVCLQDPAYNVRYRACLALGSIGSKSEPAIAELVKLYAKENQMLQGMILIVLTNINPNIPELIPLLKTALTHENQRLRYQALTATARIGNNATTLIPELIQNLEHKPLRSTVIKLLGPLGVKAQEAIPRLSQLLQQSVSNPETILLLETLGQIGVPLPELAPKMLKLLEHQDVMIRLKVAEAMVRMQIEVEKVVSVLVNALENDLQENIFGIDAIQILGDIGFLAQESVPVLQKEFQTQDWFRRHSAAVALGKINLTQRKELLSAYLEIAQLRVDVEKKIRTLPRYGIEKVDTNETIVRHEKKQGKGDGSGGGKGGGKGDGSGGGKGDGSGHGEMKKDEKHGSREGTGGGSGKKNMQKKKGKGDGSGGGSGGRKAILELLCEQSLFLMAELGSQATVATPLIRQLLEDPNPKICKMADVALKKIILAEEK